MSREAPPLSAAYESPLPRLKAILADLTQGRTLRALAIQEMLDLLQGADRAAREGRLSAGEKARYFIAILHYLLMVQHFNLAKRSRLSSLAPWRAKQPFETVHDSGHSLSFIDLDFSDVPLRALKFGDSISFSNCRFDGADLETSEFVGATFLSCSFDKANLRAAKISHGRMMDCSFVRADFSSVVMRQAEFRNCVLDDGIFSAATLSESTLHGCRLRRADLADIDAKKTAFYACDLRGVTTWHSRKGACFNGSRLEGCCFDEANLAKADFQRAFFKGCSFDKARTEGAKGL